MQSLSSVHFGGVSRALARRGRISLESETGRVDCISLRRSVISEKEEKEGKEDNYRYKPGNNASR